MVIEAASKLALMRSLPKVYDGGHVDLPEVTMHTGRRVELRADAKRPVPVGGDGESLGQLTGAGRGARGGGDPARRLRCAVIC